MVTLGDVVREVESAGNAYALRFESAMYATHHFEPQFLEHIASINRCTLDTARMIACTSFGPWQMLGETLYSDVACSMPILQICAEFRSRRMFFTRHLSSRGYDADSNAETLIHDPAALPRFAAFYNGPADATDYASRMVAAFDRLSSQDRAS